MSKLLVELNVSKKIAEAVGERFVAVHSRFLEAARETQHEDVILLVKSFDSCSENAVIKVSDPYIHSWGDTLEKSMLKAWNGMTGIIRDLVYEAEYEKPTIIFSTSITS